LGVPHQRWGFTYRKLTDKKTPLLRHRTGKTALKKSFPNPLSHNCPSTHFDFAWGKPISTGALKRFEREETERRGAVKSNCGRMQCTPAGEFTVVLREDLRGFINLGGLVGIIGV